LTTVSIHVWDGNCTFTLNGAPETPFGDGLRKLAGQQSGTVDVKVSRKRSAKLFPGHGIHKARAKELCQLLEDCP
jgi:hypothetical protein